MDKPGYYEEHIIANEDKNAVTYKVDKELSTFKITDSSIYEDPNTGVVYPDINGFATLRRDYLESFATKTFENGFYKRVLKTTGYDSYSD
ncbi:UNVERIFIED_CONTAM: hypothetical protein O8I53_06325 [Campylobacter lari]